MTAIVFKPTGEVRKAKPLEWVFDDNSFWQNRDCTETIRFYPIFTRHELPLDLVERMEKEANNAR